MSATRPVQMSGQVGPGSVWTEHRNPQGRVYWFHTIEKRSVWEKPTELKTARERAIDSTPWKEYQSGDRKYYVHSVTKESSWSLPKELKDVLDSIPDEPSPASTPMQRMRSAEGAAMPAGPGQMAARPQPAGFASPMNAGSDSPAHVMSPQGPRGERGTPTPMPIASTPAAMPAMTVRPPSGPAADRFRADLNPDISGSGEEAFLGLLRDKGVDTTWTWEQTMRQIITEPLYKALGSLAERKAAFSKYIRMLEEDKLQMKKEQVAKVTPSVRQALEEPIASNRVQPYLSYEGMLIRCKDTTAWKRLEALGIDEARKFWDVICKEMRDHEARVKSKQRQRNIENLGTLLRSFEADVTTRWKDARQTIFASDEWLTDPHLKDMDVTDMITVFDDLIKDLERQKTAELKEAAHKRKREDRKRRDWFRERLQEDVKSGKIHARTQFGDVFLRYRDEAMFKDMLGQPGSTPLELFYDVVDDLDAELQKQVKLATEVLSRVEGLIIEETTTFEVFVDALKKGHGASSTSSTSQAAEEETLKSSSESELKMLHEEFVQLAKDERRRAERKLRHLSDDLRYAFKKEAYHHPETYEPEAVLDEPWETTWRPRLENLKLREWLAFDQLLEQKERETIFAVIDAKRIDEVRHAAWDRFVKRQKEKLEERRDPAKQGKGDERKDARSISPVVSRKRRSGGEGDDAMGVDGGVTSRPSRRERRAGEAIDDAARERERRDRRSGRIDDASGAPASSKRPRRDTGEMTRGDANDDSEKEEGEV